jgi:hypothetical protein
MGQNGQNPAAGRIGALEQGTGQIYGDCARADRALGGINGKRLTYRDFGVVTDIAPERVTVTVVSSAGDSGALLVDDAMRQILDFFVLLNAAGGDQSTLISWQLEDISMKSPLRATAVAVSMSSGVEAAPIARREKALLSHSLDEIIKSAKIPDWLSGEPLSRAKALLQRNIEGIGRTEVDFYNDNVKSIITQPGALAGASAIERSETEQRNLYKLSFPSVEFGTIDGNVKDITSRYGNPAVVIRNRITGDEVTCFPSDQVSGSSHTWSEAWENKRVLVTGEISYRTDGKIIKVSSADFELVDSSPVRFEKIADPTFTGGLTPSDYLERLWSGDAN